MTDRQPAVNEVKLKLTLRVNGTYNLEDCRFNKMDQVSVSLGSKPSKKKCVEILIKGAKDQFQLYQAIVELGALLRDDPLHEDKSFNSLKEGIEEAIKELPQASNSDIEATGSQIQTFIQSDTMKALLALEKPNMVPMFGVYYLIKMAVELRTCDPDLVEKLKSQFASLIDNSGYMPLSTWQDELKVMKIPEKLPPKSKSPTEPYLMEKAIESFIFKKPSQKLLPQEDMSFLNDTLAEGFMTNPATAHKQMDRPILKTHQAEVRGAQRATHIAAPIQVKPAMKKFSDSSESEDDGQKKKKAEQKRFSSDDSKSSQDGPFDPAIKNTLRDQKAAQEKLGINQEKKQKGRFSDSEDEDKKSEKEAVNMPRFNDSSSSDNEFTTNQAQEISDVKEGENIPKKSKQPIKKFSDSSNSEDGDKSNAVASPIKKFSDSSSSEDGDKSNAVASPIKKFLDSDEEPQNTKQTKKNDQGPAKNRFDSSDSVIEQVKAFQDKASQDKGTIVEVQTNQVSKRSTTEEHMPIVKRSEVIPKVDRDMNESFEKINEPEDIIKSEYKDTRSIVEVPIHKPAEHMEETVNEGDDDESVDAEDFVKDNEQLVTLISSNKNVNTAVDLLLKSERSKLSIFEIIDCIYEQHTGSGGYQLSKPGKKKKKNKKKRNNQNNQNRGNNGHSYVNSRQVAEVLVKALTNLLEIKPELQVHLLNYQDILDNPNDYHKDAKLFFENFTGDILSSGGQAVMCDINSKQADMLISECEVERGFVYYPDHLKFFLVFLLADKAQFKRYKAKSKLKFIAYGIKCLLEKHHSYFTNNTSVVIRSLLNINDIEKLDVAREIPGLIFKLADKCKQDDVKLNTIMQALDACHGEHDLMPVRNTLMERLESMLTNKQFFDGFVKMTFSGYYEKNKQFSQDKLKDFFKDKAQVWGSLIQEGNGSPYMSIILKIADHTKTQEFLTNEVARPLINYLNENEISIDLAVGLLTNIDDISQTIQKVAELANERFNLRAYSQEIQILLEKRDAIENFLNGISSNNIQGIIPNDNAEDLERDFKKSNIRGLGEVFQFMESYPHIVKLTKLADIHCLCESVKSKLGRDKQSISDIDYKLSNIFTTLGSSLSTCVTSIEKAQYDMLEPFVKAGKDKLNKLVDVIVSNADIVADDILDSVKLFEVCMKKREAANIVKSLSDLGKAVFNMKEITEDLSKLPDATGVVQIATLDNKALLMKIAGMFQFRKEDLLEVAQCQDLLLEYKNKDSHFYDLLSSKLENIENSDEMKKMSKGANAVRQVLANFREHVKKPDNTVADVILSCSQDVIGYFSQLKSIKAKLIDMSKKIGDSTVVDKSAADSLLDGFALRYFIDQETGKYSCTASHGASRDKIETLSGLTTLVIRLGELVRINKGQGTQTGLFKKLAVLKTLRALMLETMDFLEFILEGGDVLDFSFMTSSDALTFNGKEVMFQCRSLTETINKSVSIDDEKARDILDPIVNLNRDLEKLTKNIEEEKHELMSDADYSWILGLQGKQKQTLAAYVKGDTNKVPEVKSILQFYFGSSETAAFRDSQVLIPTSANTTSAILKAGAQSRPMEARNLKNKTLDKKLKFVAFNKNKYRTLITYLHKHNINVQRLRPSQFLFMNYLLAKQEIGSFLRLAVTDLDRPYFIMDLHMMTSELKEYFFRTCKILVKNSPVINPRIIVFMNRDSDSKIYEEVSKHTNLFDSIDFRSVNVEAGSDAGLDNSIADIVNSMRAKIVSSNLAGMGKTTWIKREAKRQDSELVQFFLSGEISDRAIEKRLEIISSAAGNDGCSLLIKIDMMENMVQNSEIVDQQIFKLLFLNCSKFREGYLFTNSFRNFYLEVTNNYKNMLLEGLPIISLLNSMSSKRPELHKQIGELSFANPELFVFDDPVHAMLNIVCRAYHLTKTNAMIKKTQILSRDTWLQLDDHLRIAPRTARTQNENEFNFRDKIKMLEELFTKPEKDTDQKREASKGTMTQLVALIKVLFYQYQMMELCPAFDTTYIDTEDMYKSREIVSKFITKLSPVFVWSKIQDLRAESNIAKDLRSHLGHAKSVTQLSTETLNEFRQRITNIPEWDQEKKLNVFFSCDALKLIYNDVTDIPQELANVIKLADKLQNLTDPKSISKDEAAKYFMEQLIQALDIKPTDSFRNHFNIPAAENLAGTNKLRDKLIKIAFEFEKKGFDIILDTYLKMIIINQRASLNLPIVVMGDTGCGKTYLIKFLVTVLLREDFRVLTLHSGVTELHLEELILEVIGIANRNIENYNQNGSLYRPTKVWVFFDEFNTSPLQSLIEELMCTRTCTFSPRITLAMGASRELPLNVVFIAACNPCRINASNSSVGLVHEFAVSAFSHRVFPVPETLLNYTWSFGQITEDKEKSYVDSRLKNSGALKNLGFTQDQLDLMNHCIIESQKYIRQKENSSSVSLRDVQRVIDIFVFLYQLFATHQDVRFDDALVCTIFLNYFARIGKYDQRKALENKIRGKFNESCNPRTIELTNGREPFLQRFQQISERVIQDIQDARCLPRDICMNRALRENLFALIVSILTMTPIMLCGKPGTSKTLSTQIVLKFFERENKAGSQYFANQPSLRSVYFSGSIATTSEAVDQLFVRAKRAADTENNKGDDKQLVVIIFDEMGLAEISQNNPLKVLHPHLEPEEKKFAFIGISNWKLDLSKMNRALFIARPDLEQEDLNETCRGLTENDWFSESMVKSLSKAFDKFMKQQQGIVEEENQEEMEGDDGPRIPQIAQVIPSNRYAHPNFFGSRDFYHIVKFLQRHTTGNKSFIKTCESVTHKPESIQEQKETLVYLAIQRNMSGKMCEDPADPRNPKTSYSMFVDLYKKFRQTPDAVHRPIGLISAISMNLVDPESRHLMLLTENPSVRLMLINELRKFLTDDLHYHPDQIKVVESVEGEKDIEAILQRLSIWIKDGAVLILREVDQLYNCLYDVLNQRYITTDDDDMMGEPAQTCYLHFGENKEPERVTINPKFRVIVLADREDDIKKLSEKKQEPPFLNRFEKHLVLYEDLASHDQKNLIKELKEEYPLQKVRDSPFKSNTLIHGFNEELLYSLVLKGMQKPDLFEKYNIENYYKEALNMAAGGVREGNGGMPREELDNIKRSIHNKIVGLYSRNMLVYSALDIAQQNISYEDLNQKFLETHEDDSLVDFVKRLSSNKNRRQRKHLLFTFSQVMELQDCVSKCQELRYDVTHCESHWFFNKIQADQRKSIIRELIERHRFFVINFESKDNWKQIDTVRSVIDSIKIPNDSHVIFVAQYGYKDIACKETEAQTSITYLSSDWSMRVIDDLQGCNYRWFINLLNKPLTEVIIDQPALNMMSENAQEKDLLNGIVERCLKNRLSIVLEKDNQVWSLHSQESIRDLVQQIRETANRKFTVAANKKSESVLELLRSKDSGYRAALAEHLDSMLVLQKIIDEKYTPHVVEICEAIKTPIFQVLKDSVYLPEEERDQLFKHWMEQLRSQIIQLATPTGRETRRNQPAPEIKMFDYNAILDKIEYEPVDNIDYTSLKDRVEDWTRMSENRDFNEDQLESFKSDVVGQLISITDRLRTQVLSQDFDQLTGGIQDIEAVPLAIAALRRFFDNSRQPQNNNIVSSITRIVQVSRKTQPSVQFTILLYMVFYKIYEKQFTNMPQEKREQISEEELDEITEECERAILVKPDLLMGGSFLSYMAVPSNQREAKEKADSLKDRIEKMVSGKIRNQREHVQREVRNPGHLRVIEKVLRFISSMSEGEANSLLDKIQEISESSESVQQYSTKLVTELDQILDERELLEIATIGLQKIDRQTSKNDALELLDTFMKRFMGVRGEKGSMKILADKLGEFVEIDDRNWKARDNFATEFLREYEKNMEHDDLAQAIKSLKGYLVQAVLPKTKAMLEESADSALTCKQALSGYKKLHSGEGSLADNIPRAAATEILFQKARILSAKDKRNLSNKEKQFLNDLNTEIDLSIKEGNIPIVLLAQELYQTADNRAELSKHMPYMKMINDLTASTTLDQYSRGSFIKPINTSNEQKIYLESSKKITDDRDLDLDRKKTFNLNLHVAEQCILTKRSFKSFCNRGCKGDFEKIDLILERLNHNSFNSINKQLKVYFAKMTIVAQKYSGEHNSTPLHSAYKKLLNGNMTDFKNQNEVQLLQLASDVIADISKKESFKADKVLPCLKQAEVYYQQAIGTGEDRAENEFFLHCTIGCWDDLLENKITYREVSSYLSQIDDRISAFYDRNEGAYTQHILNMLEISKGTGAESLQTTKLAFFIANKIDIDESLVNQRDGFRQDVNRRIRTMDLEALTTRLRKLSRRNEEAKKQYYTSILLKILDATKKNFSKVNLILQSILELQICFKKNLDWKIAYDDMEKMTVGQLLEYGTEREISETKHLYEDFVHTWRSHFSSLLQDSPDLGTLKVDCDEIFSSKDRSGVTKAKEVLDSMADLSCPASRLMMIDPSVSDSLPSNFKVMMAIVSGLIDWHQYIACQWFDTRVVVRGVNLNSDDYRSDRLDTYKNFVNLMPADLRPITAANVEDLIASHVKINERSGKAELMDVQTLEEFISNQDTHIPLIFIDRDNCFVHLTESKKPSLVQLADRIMGAPDNRPLKDKIEALEHIKRDINGQRFTTYQSLVDFENELFSILYKNANKSSRGRASNLAELAGPDQELQRGKELKEVSLKDTKILIMCIYALQAEKVESNPNVSKKQKFSLTLDPTSDSYLKKLQDEVSKKKDFEVEFHSILVLELEHWKSEYMQAAKSEFVRNGRDLRIKDTDLLKFIEGEIETDDRARREFYEILLAASPVESTFKTLPDKKLKLTLKLLQLMQTHYKRNIMPFS